jgi:hypothetical protein
MSSHDLVQHALSEHALTQMSFFFTFLEQKWSIKKRNNVYILKHNRDGSKCAYTPAYLANALSLLGYKDATINELKRTQLLTFLHNALEDGWKIKKQSSISRRSAFSYVFIKKHNGQCKMYEDDEHLTQFIKNNLSLES